MVTFSYSLFYFRFFPLITRFYLLIPLRFFSLFLFANHSTLSFDFDRPVYGHFCSSGKGVYGLLTDSQGQASFSKNLPLRAYFLKKP